MTQRATHFISYGKASRKPDNNGLLIIDSPRMADGRLLFPRGSSWGVHDLLYCQCLKHLDGLRFIYTPQDKNKPQQELLVYQGHIWDVTAAYGDVEPVLWFRVARAQNEDQKKYRIPVSEMYALRMAGKSYQFIGDAAGISRQRVSEILRSAK